MKNYKFFINKKCEFYPCHKIEGKFNCLFCYCPLYHISECGGDFTIEDNIKNCQNCTIPHEVENYDLIISKIIKK